MKKKMPWIAAGALTVSGLLVGTASAVTYFSEDFQNQTIPLSAPTTGTIIKTDDSTGDCFSLSVPPAPALPNTPSGKSLKVTRETGTNPVLACYGSDGAMVNGAVLEFSWNNYQESQGFNAPIQVGIGMANGLAGRLLFVGVNDYVGTGKDQNYFYTDMNGTQIPTLKKVTINGWDKVRAVLTLSVPPEFPDYMTGTFDLFLTRDVLNGGVEEQLVNDLPLGYGLIPTADDPLTPYNDITAPLFRVGKGPQISAGPTYYDNISIANPGTVTRLPGDADNNNKVNTLDFNIMAGHFSMTGQTFDTGDFSGDGLVDSVDFGILVAHFGQSAVPGPLSASSVVPEPASVMGILSAVALLRRRRSA